MRTFSPHAVPATAGIMHAMNPIDLPMVILLLVGVNIALAVTVHQADRTVVLVPPVLDGEVTLARNAASQEVKDAWALFVAELLGNVTPRNAEVLTKALDPLLAPALRQDVLRVLDSQISEIKREKISLSFQPRAISRDAGSDTLYVTGTHITSGPAAQPVAIERTYAIRIGFHQEPIALWITDGQDGEHALSLTLAPRHVPPRKIRVTVPGYRPQGGTSTAAGADAPSARSASAVGGDGFGAASYVEGLTDLLRAMAQQRLPPGFQVGQAPFKAHCAAHLKVNKIQLTAGPSASVLTLGVRNSGQDPIAITASVCDVEQQVVAAVAAWPLKTVGPGQETEVFLVLHGAGVVASGQPQ